LTFISFNFKSKYIKNRSGFRISRSSENDIYSEKRYFSSEKFIRWTSSVEDTILCPSGRGVPVWATFPHAATARRTHLTTRPRWIGELGITISPLRSSCRLLPAGGWAGPARTPETRSWCGLECDARRRGTTGHPLIASYLDASFCQYLGTVFVNHSRSDDCINASAQGRFSCDCSRSVSQTTVDAFLPGSRAHHRLWTFMIIRKDDRAGTSRSCYSAPD
jgi:hypothetical protein